MTRHNRRRHLAWLMPLLVGAMLASTFVNTASAQEPATVRITTSLDPAFLTIETGTTVTWINSDSERHRMRSESGPVDFDTGSLDPGEAAAITFTLAGTYTYVDHKDAANHEYQGTIVVAPPATTPTTTLPAPGGGSTPPPSTTAPAAAATVRMAGRVFSPGTLTVSAGTTVDFINDDDRAHTVTATDQSWNSGVFDTGGSYQKTFSASGSYPYFCLIHPDMIGTIVVTGGSGSAPTTTQAPPPPSSTTPPTSSVPAAPGSQDVEIVDFDFSPTTISISAGGTVSWRNTGNAPHTATSDTGVFDSGFLFTGDAFTTTFPTAGTYTYYCTLHPAMRATVTVGTAAAGGSGSATAPAAGASAGAATTPTSAATTPTGGFDVAMLDNTFGPGTITVKAGSTVRWRNNGSALHTVTANNGSFDSGFSQPGANYAVKFSTPGTFGYFCMIHPGMDGTVLVTDDTGTAPAADPTATTSDTGAAVDTADSTTTTAPAGEASAPEPVRVDMVDLAFEDRDVVVTVGTEVYWVNTGRAPHTVTSEDGQVGSFANIDSDLVMPGDTFTLLFEEEGVFGYYCTLHPGMEGTVTVTAASAAGPADDVGAAAPLTGDSSPLIPEPAETSSSGFGLRHLLIIVISVTFVLGALGWSFAAGPAGTAPKPVAA